MRLIEISIENYKSYFERQTVKVEPGFNIFLGGNNSGKTTMLEVLDIENDARIPHRSMKNLPDFGSQPSGDSTMSVKIESNVHEMRDPQSRILTLPIGENWSNDLQGQAPAAAVVQRLTTTPDVELNYEFGAGRRSLTITSSLGIKNISNNTSQDVLTLSINALDDKTLVYQSLQNIRGGFSKESAEMLNRLTMRFYRFSANRRPAGQCGESGHPVVLAPDALNLPYCINVLQSTDAHGHQLLCEWINRIFPAVHWVQASPRQGNMFEIECLPLPPSARRSDLAIPLAKMGSGIGNVIAMLYIVLTARFPRVIAIDEPNSFLHPKALRELLQIFFAEGKMHQYLLTAHSADVLTAVPLSLVTMFDIMNGATVTKQVKGTELATIREGLSSLGIRMTDLHGRDRVLWVEGQTEELVMPLLLQNFCPETAAGTAVLRVEHTGTFEKKGVDPKEVAALYQRLTSATALVPPLVGILLDRETRTQSECERLVTNSKGVLKFLEKTMLENYVLHAGAVAHVLRQHGETVETSKVDEYLKAIVEGADGHLDGAKILSLIFDKFTETRTEFKKTRDVPTMIAWLLEEDVTSLQGLGDFLRGLFGLTSITGRRLLATGTSE